MVPIRDIHGPRPPQGPKVPQYFIRLVYFLRSRAKLQNGCPVLLGRFGAQQERNCVLSIHDGSQRYCGQGRVTPDLRSSYPHHQPSNHVPSRNNFLCSFAFW